MSINIFQFDDYRLYIKEVISLLKSEDPKNTNRMLSEKIGFGSHNYLDLVTKGKRNLALDSIQKISKFLKHTKDESFYFRNLVNLNQATNDEDRQLFALQILKSKGFKKAKPLAESQYHYFTRWYYVAIRELVKLKGFREDGDWIAEQFQNKVSAAEAKEALAELVALKLLSRPLSGKLTQSQDLIQTPDEVLAPFARAYHEQMIALAAESISAFSREKRYISGYTFAISHTKVDRAKELCQKFHKEMIVLLEEYEKDSDSVYQLNINLFPLLASK